MKVLFLAQLSPIFGSVLLGGIFVAPNWAMAKAAWAFGPAAAAQEYDIQVSPFSGLRWDDQDQPEVRVNGSWYTPRKIDGVDVEKILAFCDKRWPGQRKKRFGEDLIEAMVLMGHKPLDGAWRSTTLVVAELDGTGAEKTLNKVALTSENRNAIRDSAAQPLRPRRNVSRPSMISKKIAMEDLKAFGDGLRERFAYLHMRGVDLDAGLEEIATSLEGRVSSESLA